MVDTPGIPSLKWSTDQKYTIISPGVESDDFKIDSPVTDLTAISGLALSSTNRIVTRPLPATNIGDVVGPASATDNAVVRFNGTSGKLIQNSVVIVDDIGSLTLPVSSNGITFPTGDTLHDFYAGITPTNQTWTGPWAANQSSGWDFHRIGNRCFVGIGGVSATNSGAAASITSTFALPLEGRPSTSRFGTLAVIDAGSYKIASWEVNASGIITISSGAQPGLNFAGGGVLLAGFINTQLEYVAV